MGDRVPDLVAKYLLQRRLAVVADPSLYEQILGNLPDSVTIQDRDFRILYQNNAIRTVYGSHLGEECFRVYEGREQPCEGCGLQEVFASGKPSLVLRTVPNDSGPPTYWENSCFPLFNDSGEIVAGVEVCRDISSRISLEAEIKTRNSTLTQLNREYRTLLDHLPVFVVRYDRELRRTYVNPAWERATGITASECIGVAFDQIPNLKHQLNEIYLQKLKQVFATGRSQYCSFEKDNAFDQRLYLEYELIPECGPDGQVRSVLAVGRDMTGYRNAENALQQERSLLRCIIDSASDLIFVKDRNGRYRVCNRASEAFIDQTEAEQIGKSDFDFFPEEVAAQIQAQDRMVIEQGIPQQVEEWVTYPDGRRVLLDTLKVPFIGARGELSGLVGICRDVTARWQAEEALREQQRHAQSLLRLSKRLESAQDYSEAIAAARDEVRQIVGYTSLWVYLFSDDMQYADILAAEGPTSDSILSLENVARLAIAGDPMLEEIAAAEDLVIVEDARTDPRTDKEIVSQLGNRTIINVPILLFERHLGCIGTGTFGDEGVQVPTDAEREYLAAMASHMAVCLDRIRLLAESKKAEDDLRQLNRKLRAISNCNQLLIRVEDEQYLLDEVCRIICEEAGYLLAWVGYVEDDSDKRIRPMAWAGQGSDYIAQIQVSWDEKEPQGRGPAGTAIRSGETVCVQDIETDNRMEPWREKALQQGYRAGIALPLKDQNDRAFGVLLVYYEEPGGITPDEIQLLEELVGDLAFGVTVLRERRTRQRVEKALKENQELLLEAQQLAHIGNWWHDLLTGEIYWSDEIYRIVGMERQPPTEELAAKLIHPDDLPILQQAMEESAAGKMEHEHDFRVIRADGEVRWIHNHWRRINDANGREIRRVGTHQDITEQKLADEALAAREREFRTLAENSPDNIARYDSDCRTIYVNPTLEDTLGRPAAEMLGKTPEEDPLIAEAREYQEKLAEVLRTGEPAEIDLVIPIPGGGEVYHNIRFSAERGGDGEINGVLAIGRDITDRKRVEEGRKANLRFFEGMDRVNRAIQGAVDQEQLMGDVLEIVLDIFDCDRVYLLYPCDPEAEELSIPMERTRPDYPGALAEGASIPSNPGTIDILRRLLAADGAVQFGPGTGTPLSQEVAERYNFKSCMAMAIRPKLSEPWEFGIHQCAGVRLWNLDEERLLEAIGRRLSDALTSQLSSRNLQESEAKYRRIVDTANEGIWVLDAEGLTTFVNPRMAEMLGFQPNEMLGRSMTDFMLDEEISDHLRRMENRRQGIAENYERRFCRQDGQLIWVHASATPIFDQQQNFLGAFAMFTDITEGKRTEIALRENQEFLDNVVENLPNMLFVKDAKSLNFVRFNKAGEELLGYGRDELLGKNDYDFFPKEIADFFTANDRRVLESGHSLDIPEEKIQLKNGEERILHTQKIPLLDKNQQPQYLLGISEDITERKHLEEQLLQSQKMESVGALAGGVAHDFNNMLAVILGRTQLALRKVPHGDPLRASLQEIQKSAERSADLTRQLLAFARKQVIAPQIIDLNESLEGMLKMLRRLIGEDIDLVWQPGHKSLLINIDPSQLDQILVNLCVNARDAIDGAGKIVIATQSASLDEEFSTHCPESRPGEYVLLSVSDNGRGMEPATLEKIFEPFFTTKEIGRGTGLGLSTVYGIVKQNLGFILVDSTPQQGTTFKLYLPRYDEAQRPEEPLSDIGTVTEGNETILLVEDESSVLSMTRQMLEDCGYRVLCATNPLEALQLVDESDDPIDLLITDLVMPLMNGQDLADKLTEISPKTRYLFISGYPVEAIVRNDVMSSGLHFIPKPFSLEELTSRVRKILGS